MRVTVVEAEQGLQAEEATGPPGEAGDAAAAHEEIEAGHRRQQLDACHHLPRRVLDGDEVAAPGRHFGRPLRDCL